jgi:beta-phosphoglucomutase-like phosphatase (HAD superfamily)
MQTLFIDFDGTICTDRFWRSHPQYARIQQTLFETNPQLANDWMRGQYSSEYINQFIADHTGINYEELWDLFVADAESMHVPTSILQICRELQSHFQVVLITGNMDCFSRFTVPALQLEKYFHAIVNSFDEQKLKTDNGGESFVHHCHGNITDAILVEDSPKTIAVFCELGGTAHQVESLEHTLQILKTLYESTNRN